VGNNVDAALSIQPVVHYVLRYETIADYVTQRQPYREMHLALASSAASRGELVLGGAFDDPSGGAMLVFRGDSPEAAERFAQSDPYVLNGLVTRWTVQKWNVVIGA
jgi:uncharacterized protein YciI